MAKRLCLLLALFLLAQACRKDPRTNGGEEPDPDVPAALALSDNRISDAAFSVDSPATVEYVGVKTNIADWTATVISDGGGWVLVEPARDLAVPATSVEVTQKLELTIT